MDFVVYNDKKYEIKDDTLNLAHEDIEDIFDIENLNKIPKIKKLYLTYNKLTEIKGLDNLTDLEILKLDHNKISEIKGLVNLKNLKELSLEYNKISRIKGLDDLDNLKKLDLQRNVISEINGLDSLKNLTGLYLWNNNISEIKGLENLKNLETLNLARNKITEIKGLDFLLKLKFLNLEQNQINEFKGLTNLINLEEFSIGASKIKEIKGLGALKSLKKLKLEKGITGRYQIPMGVINKLGGIDYRTGNTKDPQKIVNYCKRLERSSIEYVLFNGKKYKVIMNSLDLHDKGIKNINDIEGIKKLKDLEELSLGLNSIRKIEGLETLIKLKKLDLGRNMISKMEGLDNLHNLEHLVLSGNRISSIENVDNLTKLRQLWIGENAITSISGLEKLTNLDHLSMSENKISKIEGLETLKNLEYLNLDNNQISDISNLRILIGLKHLSLGYNKIRDISVLEYLNEIEELTLWHNEISEVKSLSRLQKLKHLLLSSNKIKLPTRKRGYVSDSDQLIEYVRLMGKISDNKYNDLNKEQIDILKGLSEMGHVDAKRVHFGLIISKSKDGDLEAFRNLFEGDYLKSFDKEEIQSLIQDPNINFIKSILSILEYIKYSRNRENVFKFLVDYSHFIDREQKNAIAEWSISKDYEFLSDVILDGFLRCLDKESAEIILNDDKFKQKLIESLEEKGYRSSESLKILREFTILGSQSAKALLKERIIFSLQKSNQFELSEILRNNYLDYFGEKEFDIFLKESSPNFLTEFLNLLNQDYGVQTIDISHFKTEKPEEIKQILKKIIIKLISFNEPEKVYRSKKYTNFLGVLNDPSIVFNLIDVVRDSTGINLFNQVKELWKANGIEDIKFLTKLLGKLVIYSTETKIIKDFTDVVSEEDYFIREIFLEFHDLFKSILLGYYSADSKTQLKQINLILELVLFLNKEISYGIEGYFEHVDLYDVETEYEVFKLKKDQFKEFFHIKNRYSTPHITLKIEDQKLKISGQIYKEEKLDEINQKAIKFVLNRKKISEDRVIEQKWFKDFLRDYYQSKNYSKLIRDLTGELKVSTKTLEKPKKLDLNDIVNFRGTLIPIFESKVLKEIELYSTRKFTHVNEFDIKKDTNFFIMSWDENAKLRDMTLNEKDEYLKSHGEIKNYASMGFTTKNNRITGLSIHYGNTTKIPDAIGQLTALKQLYITGSDSYSRNNVQIDSLPSSIGQLTLLEVLIVTGQGLINIPDSIGNLTKLYHLNLDNNNLKTLPESIGNLENLMYFYIGHNQLLELPKSFRNLKSLITLDMIGSFNKDVKSPPNLDGLNNLEYLNLMNSSFSEIKGLGNLMNLISVNLRNNKITEIKNLENLKKIKLLNISANDLSEIKGLEKLKNLIELDISGNEVGGGNISEIKNLDNLSKLRRLNLGKHKINEIKGLENLKNLEVLNLFQNQIRQISGLTSLVNLKELHISRNSIKELEGLENLHNLEIFEIGKCFSRELVAKLGGVEETSYGGMAMNDFNKAVDPLKFVKYCSELKGLDIDFKQIEKERVIKKFNEEIIKNKSHLKILRLLHKKDNWSLQELKNSPDTAYYQINDFIKHKIIIIPPNTKMVRLNPYLKKPLNKFFGKLTRKRVVSNQEFRKNQKVKTAKLEEIELKKEDELNKKLIKVEKLLKKAQFGEAKDSLEIIISEAKKYHLNFILKRAQDKLKANKQNWIQ